MRDPLFLPTFISLLRPPSDRAPVHVIPDSADGPWTCTNARQQRTLLELALRAPSSGLKWVWALGFKASSLGGTLLEVAMSLKICSCSLLLCVVKVQPSSCHECKRQAKPIMEDLSVLSFSRCLLSKQRGFTCSGSQPAGFQGSPV